MEHSASAARRHRRCGRRRAAAIPTGQVAGSEAELVLRLDQAMSERLRAEGLFPIYESLEMPSSRYSPTSSAPA